jgi:hypothetical protein
MDAPRVVALACGLTILLPLVLADAHGDCDSKGQPALGIVEIAGIAYIDDRNYLLGNGVWVYLESNGVGHLQRGASCGWPDDCEICYDDSDVGPDTLLF